MEKFRVIIFSSNLYGVHTFLVRLEKDLPEVRVAGVLFETMRPPLSTKERIKRARQNLQHLEYLRFVINRVVVKFTDRLQSVIDSILRKLHGTSGSSNDPGLSLEQVQHECTSKGVAFKITSNIHSQESLEFVKGLHADLGVIYGTRVLRPELFSLPRRGTINIHKHKVPEYRGSGAPGIWEMRDGQTEQGITVHRVLKEVDAGGVLVERTFKIDQYDTLESVGLKADVVGFDCLVEAIRNESRGTTIERPQASEGTVYKGYKAYQIWNIERTIKAKREKYKPRQGRPLYKLLLRTLLYPAVYLRNRRFAREKNFPVVILYHHVISDRPHFMGCPTDYFLRHVRYLKKHYRIVLLGEALEMLRKGEVAQPTVVLTFDDGYEDNFLCLRAVVEAEHVPVTLFVCTDHIAKCSPFQHDLELGETGFPAMNWEQVKYFSRHGATIGSHTRTHFDCGAVDTKRLHEEIVGSQEDLQRELGHQVEHFSFPFGSPKNMSAEAVHIAMDTYPYVFSACGGVNHMPLAAGTLINRWSHPESLLELELLMQGILDFKGGFRRFVESVFSESGNVA